MIEQEVNKASIALKEEKEHLIAFLKDRMSTIIFPENQNLVEANQGSASTTNENLPKYLLGGGVAGVIVGLCGRCCWCYRSVHDAEQKKYCWRWKQSETRKSGI